MLTTVLGVRWGYVKCDDDDGDGGGGDPVLSIFITTVKFGSLAVLAEAGLRCPGSPYLISGSTWECRLHRETRSPVTAARWKPCLAARGCVCRPGRVSRQLAPWPPCRAAWPAGLRRTEERRGCGPAQSWSESSLGPCSHHLASLRLRHIVSKRGEDGPSHSCCNKQLMQLGRRPRCVTLGRWPWAGRFSPKGSFPPPPSWKCGSRLGQASRQPVTAVM